MRLVLSWLKEFVDVKASAEDVAQTLALRGFEVASIEALDAGDAVIDFEVTANRPDALSVIGLAREVATACHLPLRSSMPLADVPVGYSDRITVTLERPRSVSPVRRRCRRRDDGQFAGVDGGAPAGRRRPADQQHRRHHQLREPRARPADARLRPGHTGGRVTHRASSEAGRNDDDARWGGAQAGRRHAGHRRPRSRAGRRRRDGRRRVGSVGGDKGHRVRSGVFQPGVDPAIQQAARPENRSVVALRARRRSQRPDHRDSARRRVAAADRRGTRGRIDRRCLPPRAATEAPAPAPGPVGAPARRIRAQRRGGADSARPRPGGV